MKNKKGFTLVELLAVIAILAILVIMALPAVLRMFNNARRDSFTNEVNTVIRTARQQYLLSGGTDTTWSNAAGSTKSLDLTGNSRLIYYVKMNNEGKITKLQVSNGDYQYNVTNNAGIDIAESSSVEEVTEENALELGSNSSIAFINRANSNSISVGDEVAIDTEHFYVISSNSNETLLLAKYSLNTTLNSQVQSGSTQMNFTDTVYWTDGSGHGTLISPYNANGASHDGNPYPYVYDQNSNLYPYVNSYVEQLSNSTGINITGRLMSYEEANSLSTNMRRNLNIDYYWLGSSNFMPGYSCQNTYIPKSNIVLLSTNNSEARIVRGDSAPVPGLCGIAALWFVDSEGELAFFAYDTGFPVSSASIRPVIVVPTSSMPN